MVSIISKFENVVVKLASPCIGGLRLRRFINGVTKRGRGIGFKNSKINALRVFWTTPTNTTRCKIDPSVRTLSPMCISSSPTTRGQWSCCPCMPTAHCGLWPVSEGHGGNRRTFFPFLRFSFCSLLSCLISLFVSCLGFRCPLCSGGRGCLCCRMVFLCRKMRNRGVSRSRKVFLLW